MYASNGNGGYAAFSEKPWSKYCGVFHFENGEMFKILEGVFSETNISFSYSENSFSLYNPKKKWISFPLDIRKIYDESEFGRIYEVEKKKNNILVKFYKEKNGEKEFSFFVCFRVKNGEIHLQKQWKEVEYFYDKKREGGGKNRWVFEVFESNAEKIEITFLREKKRNSLHSNLKKCAKKHLFNTLFSQKKGGNQNKTTFTLLKNSLLALVITQYGEKNILAGHPWFFQFWTRDSAISCKGLWLTGEKKGAKKILFNLLQKIDETGRIPNRIPKSDIGCADGVGWVFFRLKELFLAEELSKKEKIFVQEKLKESLQKIEKYWMKNELIENNSQETWMDTVWENDERSGARIEIQALTLAMYDFLEKLEKKRSERLVFLKKNILKYFWNGAYLNDGSEDKTIRPNLFLAYYVYPQLLEEEKWEKVFDTALEHLWLDWGGLATIEKSNPLFCAEHTGKNNKSYHRGDSWYFLNNIAAICLFRWQKKQNSQKYQRYIDMIFTASEKNFKKQGAKNACSEISSAAYQTAEGCWNQAWSCATLLELIHESKLPHQE